MISISLVVAAQVESREMDPSPGRRRMSDSDLSLKSAENSVKLSYQRRLEVQSQMEPETAAVEKGREFLQEELEKHSSLQPKVEEFTESESSGYVGEYFETSEAWSDSGTTESGDVSDFSSIAVPSELRREERGRKSRTKSLLLYCVALCCVALCCVVLRCVALRCVALRCIALHCVALRCAV